MANTTAGKAGILGGKRTVYASGPGLTCIALPQEDSEEGNIHTGATPPWLKQDDKEGSGEIGPTAEAFQKHLQSLQKKKLPTGRVGATFSHKVDTSQQWLPAFGRVWNSGRRLNSQQQFLREKSRDGGKRHSANHSARRSWPTTPQRGVDEAVPSGSSETYFREEHATGQEAIVPYWKRPPMACHDEGGGFSSVQVNGAATSSHCDGVHPAYTHVHNYGAQSSRPGKAMLVAAEMEAVKKKRPWESTAPIRTKTTTSATPEEEERGGFVKLPLAYRPYKRQRTGQTTHTGTPVSTPVMIPIVSKLLSEPAGIKHHSL